jgi:hypothetical protein
MTPEMIVTFVEKANSGMREDLGPTPDDRRALMDGCIDAIEIAIALGRVT